MSKIYHFSKYIKAKEKVTFSKKDLNSIISIYSQKVSNGIWKDYSINFEKNYAEFSIYRHSYASPEFSIIKNKKNIFYIYSRKQELRKSKYIKDILNVLKKVESKKNLQII
ncbi:MAG: hypothetical protein CFH28_00140 [Alphaproteobacteria bacterium MarineAlpha6_Bin6]|nr:MAG: hypothetical protein CFH28_00140 [Alphaproteobacteria bacterium MarineAlpha6_Bin6]PPR32737.1 MAG: hypothetical protein CFH27_01029 [Alphaproteobacteria bacterium MarineAlpha6_Bin5]|tara:strand:+ start:450 stop:782 length:333 start_codon:yes stop_codon:yes gene_type:complete